MLTLGTCRVLKVYANPGHMQYLRCMLTLGTCRVPKVYANRRHEQYLRLIPSTSCEHKADRRSLGKDHFHRAWVAPDTVPCFPGEQLSVGYSQLFSSCRSHGHGSLPTKAKPKLCINAGLTMA